MVGVGGLALLGQVTIGLDVAGSLALQVLPGVRTVLRWLTWIPCSRQ
jgi:hypothetical protein